MLPTTGARERARENERRKKEEKKKSKKEMNLHTCAWLYFRVPTAPVFGYIEQHANRSKVVQICHQVFGSDEWV